MTKWSFCFQVEHNEGCNFDWVKVFDTNGTLLKHVCGFLSQDLVSSTLSFILANDQPGNLILAPWCSLTSSNAPLWFGCWKNTCLVTLQFYKKVSYSYFTQHTRAPQSVGQEIQMFLAQKWDWSGIRIKLVSVSTWFCVFCFILPYTDFTVRRLTKKCKASSLDRAEHNNSFSTKRSNFFAGGQVHRQPDLRPVLHRRGRREQRIFGLLVSKMPVP